MRPYQLLKWKTKKSPRILLFFISPQHLTSLSCMISSHTVVKPPFLLLFLTLLSPLPSISSSNPSSYPISFLAPEGTSLSLRSARTRRRVPYCWEEEAKTSSTKSKEIYRYVRYTASLYGQDHFPNPCVPSFSPRSWSWLPSSFLQDAMQVVRNVVFDPRMLPGGGATELAISQAINRSVNDIEGESINQSVSHCTSQSAC